MSKHKGRKKQKKPPVMPGFDYGVNRSNPVMTAPAFSDEMRNADIIACAYGQMPAHGLAPIVPCISMVARDPAPLKRAFQQFQAWIEATGADALKVDILYSSEGYHIAFGPNYQHAMWRTVGVDQFSSPDFFGVTYIKTIDTRNPLLDDLAEYSKRPVAPIMLLGAHFTGTRPNGPAPKPSEIQSIPDCPSLLLYHLPVYKTKEEVPEFSGLRIIASKPTEEELERSRKEFGERNIDPENVSRSRERRLRVLMPVTLHMLRTYPPMQQKVTELQARGLVRWQIEQAVVNQRLWSQIMPEQRVRLQNRNDLYRAVEQFAELDAPSWDDIADDPDAVIGQILRDARALLKSLGVNAPHTLEECQKELAERGYVQEMDAA